MRFVLLEVLCVLLNRSWKTVGPGSVALGTAAGEPTALKNESVRGG